jgi:hypothetical protein
LVLYEHRAALPCFTRLPHATDAKAGAILAILPRLNHPLSWRLASQR